MALKAVSVLTPLVGQLVLAATLLSAQPASAQMVDLGDFTAPSTLSYQNSFNGQHNQFTDWYAFSVPAT
ncbi:MAG TPA: hypothetical protein PKE57_14300, partial [Cellvibrionaceae bacterium]|nr:hypothetical protein [Cellvibrionaceae bacterium]